MSVWDSCLLFLQTDGTKKRPYVGLKIDKRTLRRTQKHFKKEQNCTVLGSKKTCVFLIYDLTCLENYLSEFFFFFFKRANFSAK